MWSNQKDIDEEKGFQIKVQSASVSFKEESKKSSKRRSSSGDASHLKPDALAADESLFLKSPRNSQLDFENLNNKINHGFDSSMPIHSS
jgi:hypothetical protein